MKSLGWAVGFFIGAAILWWFLESVRSGPDELRLLEIPHQIEESLQSFDFDDATRFLAPEFEYLGLNRALVRAGLQRFIEEDGWIPYVARVEFGEELGDELFRIVVAGVLIPGGLQASGEQKTSQWRPFFVRAIARPRGRDWEITKVSLK